MKGLFPEYTELSSRNYGDAWKQALFVFDTNVLLNLYRYQSGTRDELLKILGELSDRIWIPHHVALEFQRNRLKVIAEQNKRFSDVRRTIEKARISLFADLDKLQLQKRHSLINPQPLMAGFDQLANAFLSDLDRLRETQQKLSEPDPLKDKIEALFDGRVGLPPNDQMVLDDIYKRAEVRFRLRIPPGYEDREKDKNDQDEYTHGGLIYKRKFGDYLIWDQLLYHAKSANIKSVVLITDDSKEDWWRMVDSDGPKTIGPRPELVEEARLISSITSFLMYAPDGFLKYAQEFLKAHVSEETLTEVRDVSTTKSLRDMSFSSMRESGLRAERAVRLWLQTQFKDIDQNPGFPDFVAYRDGNTYGFEVKVVQHSRMIFPRLRDTIYRAYYELKEKGFAELAIVWVVNTVSEINEVKQAVRRHLRDQMPRNLRMIVGILKDQGEDSPGFIPYDDFLYGDPDSSE